LGFQFEVKPADVDERAIEYKSPRELAMKAAYQKVLSKASELTPSSILVGCDTIVVLDGTVFGKPANADEALQMLRTLSGRRHSVISGVAVKATPSSVLLDAEESYITFRELSEREIREYVESGEPMDKAGAYAIQGGARAFVEKIEGDYWNVVGLPIHKLLDMLSQYMDVGEYRKRASQLREFEL
jgi:septum formation protein